MSTWYYADAGHQRQGPVDAEELARLRREGRIQWNTLVWREGLTQWEPLSSVINELPVQDTASAPATTLDAGSGRVIDSPYAPPAAPLLYESPVHQGGEIVYGGFWKRFAALMIDSFIVGIAGYAIQLPILFSLGMFSGGFENETPTGGMVLALIVAYVGPILLQMFYFAWFHSSGKQATPGKMAVGLKVVTESGGRISFARGVGRYFATWISSFILLIGYIMAAFTDRKRALHDMIASTLVVDQWAYTERPDLQSKDLGVVTIVILILCALFFLAMIGFVVVMIGAIASSVGKF